MEDLKRKYTPLYSVKPDEGENNSFLAISLEGQEIGKVPYSKDNTGTFPQTFQDALYKQPLYVCDENLYKNLVTLYTLPYLNLPNFLRMDVSQLTHLQLYYLQLFILRQKYIFLACDRQIFEISK